MTYTDEMTEFGITLAQSGKFNGHGPGVIAAIAKRLSRLAGQYQRLSERDCNYANVTAGEYERIEDRVGQVTEAELGPIFTRDPRGAAVKLSLVGRNNDWAGEGYCVPVRS